MVLSMEPTQFIHCWRIQWHYIYCDTGHDDMSIWESMIIISVVGTLSMSASSALRIYNSALFAHNRICTFFSASFVHKLQGRPFSTSTVPAHSHRLCESQRANDKRYASMAALAIVEILKSARVPQLIDIHVRRTLFGNHFFHVNVCVHFIERIHNTFPLRTNMVTQRKKNWFQFT